MSARTVLALPFICSGLLAAGHATAQTVPEASVWMAQAQQCSVQAQSDPAAAVALAESLLARKELPPVPRLRIRACLAMAQDMLGQYDAAEASVRELGALADRPDIPPQERLPTWFMMAGILTHAGQAGQASALLERAQALAIAQQDRIGQVNALLSLGNLHAMALEDVSGALGYFDRARALIGDGRGLPPGMVALVHYNRGYTLLLLKRYAEALAALDEADRIAVRMPDGDSLRHRIAGHRAWIEVEQGQVGPARQSLVRVLAWQRKHDLVAASVTLTRLAKLELRDGHPRKALPHAEEALRIAEQGHFRDERRESLEVLVRLHAALGDSAGVERYAGLLGESAKQGGQTAALVSLARLQARAQQSLTAPAQQSRVELARAKTLRNAAVAALVGLLAVGGAALWWMSTRQRRAERASRLDPLTGLANRREADRRIGELPALPAGSGSRCALLMVDVDHFKDVNDGHGHAIGDKVLVAVTSRLRSACDEGDIIARWGGEEFLVARADTSMEAAFALAEHLRGQLAGVTVPLPEGGAVAVTVSVGVAPWPFFADDGREAWTDALRMADMALYVAKRGGRDAWAAIWGTSASGDHVELRDVRADPEKALAMEWVAIGGNRPMNWSGAAKGVDRGRPGPSQGSAATQGRKSA